MTADDPYLVPEQAADEAQDYAAALAKAMHAESSPPRPTQRAEVSRPFAVAYAFAVAHVTISQELRLGPCCRCPCMLFPHPCLLFVFVDFVPQVPQYSSRGRRRHLRVQMLQPQHRTAGQASHQGQSWWIFFSVLSSAPGDSRGSAYKQKRERKSRWDPEVPAKESTKREASKRPDDVDSRPGAAAREASGDDLHSALGRSSVKDAPVEGHFRTLPHR